MFAFQQARGQVDVAFTDRHGGTSGGPFASLDLAEPRPGDEADAARAVRHNLDLAVRAFTGLGPEAATPTVVRMRQVHGADVHRVGAGSPAQTGDGLVTDERGVVLLVRIADCVPVLLADDEAGVVAAAHAGRSGLVAGVVPRTVDAMRSLGAERVTAWIGPHVCGGCYEVPDRMRAEVSEVVPAAYAETSWGTPSLDIGAGVRAQLDTAGAETLEVTLCTIEDDNLYSYRRQGARSGRLGGLVWVRG